MEPEAAPPPGEGAPATAPITATKGAPWSQDEHAQFLAGLAALGKGNWRGISRSFVPSRTPTQVASHAQKYFVRAANVGSKRKSRFCGSEQAQQRPRFKAPRIEVIPAPNPKDTSTSNTPLDALIRALPPATTPTPTPLNEERIRSWTATTARVSPPSTTTLSQIQQIQQQQHALQQSIQQQFRPAHANPSQQLTQQALQQHHSLHQQQQQSFQQQQHMKRSSSHSSAYSTCMEQQLTAASSTPPRAPPAVHMHHQLPNTTPLQAVGMPASSAAHHSTHPSVVSATPVAVVGATATPIATVGAPMLAQRPACGVPCFPMAPSPANMMGMGWPGVHTSMLSLQGLPPAYVAQLLQHQNQLQHAQHANHAKQAQQLQAQKRQQVQQRLVRSLPSSERLDMLALASAGLADKEEREMSKRMTDKPVCASPSASNGSNVSSCSQHSCHESSAAPKAGLVRPEPVRCNSTQAVLQSLLEHLQPLSTSSSSDSLATADLTHVPPPAQATPAAAAQPTAHAAAAFSPPHYQRPSAFRVFPHAAAGGAPLTA